MKKKYRKLPVRKEMCATCPFRKGVKKELADLKGLLAESACSEASRICHSTGSNNAINRRTGKPPMICRGSRNIQLQLFHAIGFIEAPTDEAWDKRVKELGL